MTFRLTKTEPSENAVLSAIMKALALHPAVGAFWRQNTGAHVYGEGKDRRFIRFGFRGSPDIHGFMRDGRALYIEAKRPSGRLTEEQRAFLDKARQAGCVAFVARSASETWEMLEFFQPTNKGVSP